MIDTSVLIAVFFDEEHAAWSAERMSEHASELRMSTVNLAETLILLRDRQPQLYEQLERELLESRIRFVPPDVEQATVAAAARLRYPLNLGDRFAYALATLENCPLLTLDADFRAVECTVLMP